MSRDRRLGEVREVGIRDYHALLVAIDQAAQSRAEHDGNLREIGRQGSDRLGSFAGTLVERTIVGHRRIPAIQAERKLASVPATRARKPRRARSALRSG